MRQHALPTATQCRRGSCGADTPTKLEVRDDPRRETLDPFDRFSDEQPSAAAALPPLHTSRLGLGTWPAGRSLGMLRDPRSPAALAALLSRSVELGMGWIDTAPTYDGGEAEEGVGRFIGTLPPEARPVVITKGGVVRDLGDARTRPVSVLRPSVIRGQLERSLQRLRLESVPVYLLHYPDESGIPIEESWGVIAELQRDGKIQRAGLCGFSAAELRRCEAAGHVDVLMRHFSPLADPDTEAMLAFCRSKGIQFIAWGAAEPLRLIDRAGPGPLAGTPFDSASERLRTLSEPGLGTELMVTTMLGAVASEHDVSLEAAAAAWQLSWGPVVGALAGASSPLDLDRASFATSLELSADELDRIDRVGGWTRERRRERETQSHALASAAVAAAGGR